MDPNPASSSTDISRISSLEKRLKSFSSSQEAQEQDSENEHKVFLGILREACDLVRSDSSPTVVERVDAFINRAVEFGYEGGVDGEEIFDYMPSFAHCEEFPEVKDADDGGVAGLSYGFTMFVSFMEKQGLLGSSSLPPNLPKPPAPHHTTPKPHPSTTPLSRFRAEPSSPSLSPSTPLASIIYQARCEVSGDTTASPTDMSISSGYTCLVVPSAGGWKNRSPGLSYFLLGVEDGDFVECRHVKVRLSDIAYHSATDESRKLIFVADDNRIKSYAWGPVGSGEFHDEALPTHTLASDSRSGPLALLPNGHLIRAGKGSAAFWDLSSLQTHGPSGRNRIGSEFSTENTWRDDPEAIEDSSGSNHTGIITFAEHGLSPNIWHPHPSIPSAMLCGLGSSAAESHSCSCVVVDLEHGGKTVSRYIGHGGTISDFSTAAQGTGGWDGNVFVTACTDGYARLYDVRHPLPALTLDVGSQRDTCSAVVLAYPDSVPTIFTGSESHQQIKLWDVRARQVKYELSTGNNSVLGLAWDPIRNALYATTGCEYMDRMGNHHGYRKAKVPKVSKPKPKSKGEEEDGMVKEGEEEDNGEWEDEDEEDDDEDDDDDDDDDYSKNWPEKAHHSEDYFGYMLDAGDNTIFRYAFKADADPSVLPAYGDARRGDPYNLF